MKKVNLLIVLFFCFCKIHGQEPIQESYVSKTLVNVDQEWSQLYFSRIINVSSNRTGQLKIENAALLTDLSGGKAKMLDESAYSTAVLNSQVLTKEKTEKNGLVHLTYEGKLVFKTFDVPYTPKVKITFIINKADVIGLQIYNSENDKEYLLSLEIKEAGFNQ
jgi:hypothetical protein